MRAMLCNEFTWPDGLAMGEIAPPVPADDEVLIDVEVASVSFMDYLMASGGYQMRPELPYAPGTDACGIIRTIGKGVTQFAPGDRVTCANWHGGFAEQMITKEWKCVHVPDGVEAAAAATVLHNYGTAYYALIVRDQLKAGETIFITGAAGGVGLATVDLARKLGGRIIAGVGSDDKAAIVKRYGAEAVVNYNTEDLSTRIKELTGGQGVDVCFDNVGGEVFQKMTRLMNWAGRLMPIGFTSGDIPTVPMNLPLVKNYSIVGLFSGAWFEKFRDEGRQANNAIMAWLAAGEINPHIDRIMPLEQAAEAMQLIADRKTQGRIVLQVT
ncbi:MAG: NADPH:quinone oxidoreductase family protein [Rhodospirillaceae bacterium]|jgi:NADPH2:quinone reductase|nr:NADPH:quinone oxidoreductase family protein [Rhodospirillaceae bacterium]MBT4691585.1 NADPH:quinone oxidoreductase family protein [Rhodospirillaceae bacterium]MBT5079527.1 NADPH:quinone oxidoreductase family protein [Rhodospirillaceae bacterium]MBT5527323.1 NADPH:quinone oxidoreductase family protein [Rhodospirillaceae bacterium]MBT5879398.1 NADPH:quinone oxidoreductase family protein [Rhodospirillaceae bacterium]